MTPIPKLQPRKVDVSGWKKVKPLQRTVPATTNIKHVKRKPFNPGDLHPPVVEIRQPSLVVFFANKQKIKQTVVEMHHNNPTAPCGKKVDIRAVLAGIDNMTDLPCPCDIPGNMLLKFQIGEPKVG